LDLGRVRQAVFSWATVKVLVLAALLLGLGWWGRRAGLTVPGALAAIRSLGPVGSAAAFVGLYVFVTLAPISIRDPLKVIGVVVFGPWLSAAYLAVADLVAAVLSFYLAKALGREFVERVVGARIGWINERLSRDALRNMILLRVLPTPYRHLNFLSGVTRIATGDFVWGTLIGASIRALYGQLLLWPFAGLLLRGGSGPGWIAAVAVGGLVFMTATMYGTFRLARRLRPAWFGDGGQDGRA
jgi:uncharacterized membrane protein YdjX (TVP38/TMEM64 family)